MKLINISICILFTSCTYAVTLVHTEGTATDVVDETATNTPDTSLSVPIN